MSIKDRILKRRERFAYERAHWVDADPEESWFYLMTNIQRNNLYSLVLIGPAIFCILFYYFTGITPNIALSYLIIDMIVIFAKRHFAIRRIREDQAYARLGDRTEVLLQMARELSEKDQMKREQNTDHTGKDTRPPAMHSAAFSAGGHFFRRLFLWLVFVHAIPPGPFAACIGQPQCSR